MDEPVQVFVSTDYYDCLFCPKMIELGDRIGNVKLGKTSEMAHEECLIDNDYDIAEAAE